MLPLTITFGEVLDVPAGRAVLQKYLPDFVAANADLRSTLVGAFTRVVPALRDDPDRYARFRAELEAAMAPARHREHVQIQLPQLTDDAGENTAARWEVVGQPTQWGVLEIELSGPADGNPFTDVELVAQFQAGGREWTVGGFYDGAGTYRLRVLAEVAGEWSFSTRSNVVELHGITGRVQVGPAAPGAHGPVRVDGYHFRYADGTRYRPWGTTAYAWNHQPAPQQEATLRTLAEAPFTKLRMCLFPKHFVYNTEEPEHLPFVRTASGGYDVTRFDVAFFQQLDTQIADLAARRIEADLILFHPYDRWGFADLGAATDAHVVRYVVRRLAAFANVWWSLANEWDLLVSKTVQDWDRIGEQVAAQDPHGHLISIHNFAQHFEHSRPWITHASVQRTDPYRTTEETLVLRQRWGKPVVYDECGYEGDLEFDWGNISVQEMVRRFWEGSVRGGYVTHGETYWAADEQLWWAKGGQLRGSSAPRIAFLEQVVADSPSGVLEPTASDFDLRWAGVEDEYLVSYHGSGRMRERHVLLPPGTWRVQVLTPGTAPSRSSPGSTSSPCTCRCPPSRTRPFA